MILSEEVLDGGLLPAVDPASEDQEQQLPWLKLRFHIPPDARLRITITAMAIRTTNRAICFAILPALITFEPGILFERSTAGATSE